MRLLSQNSKEGQTREQCCLTLFETITRVLKDTLRRTKEIVPQKKEARGCRTLQKSGLSVLHQASSPV